MSSDTPTISAGLDALFGSKSKKNTPNLNKLLIKDIRPNANQPRQDFNEDELSVLAESLKVDGILQPIIVRPLPNNFYEIVAGERRWRAAGKAGLEEVPVIIKELSDEKSFTLALIENIQRENLNAIEEAEAYQQLTNEYHFSHQELSNKIGKSRSHITNMLRLNGLSKLVKKHIRSNKLSVGHAKVLLTLNSELQDEISAIVIENSLSVRDTETLIQRKTTLQNVSTPSESNKVSAEYFNKVPDWKKQLSERFLSSVDIKFDKKGRGTIKFVTSSPEEVSRLFDQLMSG